MLKQLNNDPEVKQKFLALLADENDQAMTKLITSLGDKEYSILTALGSQRQSTRLSALEAVADDNLVKQLSSNELYLVEFVILQLLG